MNEEMPLVSVTRPNGKVYRPRKGPSVVEFYSFRMDAEAVAVLRTHDIERAMKIANRFDMNLGAPRLSWWRLVPWDYSGEFDQSWINDDVRGVPVVTFDE